MLLKRRENRGFTLLELLIVLVIIGVVIASVTLVLRDSNLRSEARSTANILRARMMYVEQQAAIQSTVIGFAISQHGYQFYRLQQSTDLQKPQWQVIEDEQALAYQSISSSLDLRLSLPGNPNALISSTPPKAPMIIVNPSAGITPFTLTINGLSLIAKANGEVVLEKR